MARYQNSGREHRTRKRAAGREDAEAEHDLPQTRQHPQALRREPEQHEGEQPAGHPGRDELLGRSMDHRIGKARMNPSRARHHLDADENNRDGGSRDPDSHVVEKIARRIRQPERLNSGRRHRHDAGRGHCHRPVAAKFGAARQLASDRRDVGQCPVQLFHAHLPRYFAVQSIRRGGSKSRNSGAGSGSV